MLECTRRCTRAARDRGAGAAPPRAARRTGNERTPRFESQQNQASAGLSSASPAAYNWIGNKKSSSIVSIRMSYIKGSRTNLGSESASISTTVAGEGEFRTAYHGTYRGGQRNQQEAICKKFKPKYARMQDEYFAADFKVADKCIEIAEHWNQGCTSKREIQITRGDIQSTRDGTKYLVEPLIRYFTKFTSNNGWISKTGSTDAKYMEAFAHYSYHRSGGQLLICDLQGRYRNDKWKAARCRFELTDPAICSRQRRYGPTDLGEKGIESFFANHVCNEFCSHFGRSKKKRWSRPKQPEQWFPLSEGTSMLSSLFTAQLSTTSRTMFTESMMTVAEGDEEEESDSDDYYGY
jgi:hypothetical protein